jgi:hypothetical protein
VSTVELHRPPFWRAVGIALETCWRHVGTCLAVSAAYAAVTAVPNVVFAAFAPEVDPLRLSGAEAFAIIAFAVAALGSFVLGGLLVFPATLGGLSLVGAAGVAGEPVDTGGVIRRAIDRALPASGAFILVLVIAMAVPAVLGALSLVVAVGVGSHTAIPLAVLAGLSLLFPGAYVFVRLSLAVPIAVLEDAGPVESVRNSWELMRGAFWWALGVYVVIGFASAAVAGLIGAIRFTARTASAGDFAIATIRNVLAGMFAVSISGVAVGVVYAAREVPPDARPPAATEAPTRVTPPPPLPVPVPIPLHAFDHMVPPRHGTSRGGTEPWPPSRPPDSSEPAGS